jgi:polyisoprenoid-binding protein YceI
VSKVFKLVLGAFVVVVVLAGAGVAYFVLKESADDQASLGGITVGTTAAGGAGGSGGSSRTSADGRWTVQQGDGVFIGYRVHEKLRGLDKEVTGRSPVVSGTLTVSGSSITGAEFTGDLRQLKSDEAPRDSAIKRMGPETDKFPEAKFTLTGPLALPSAPAVGQEVQVTAKGSLTVHGVTKAVDFPLVAQWDGETIRAATTGGGVRFEFKDYGFDALTAPVAETDDFGFLEVQLLFVPA